MGRDTNIRRRDALVIPGGLLVVYSLAGIIYAEGFRSTSDFCPDGSWVLINSVCYTVWKMLLPVLLIGIGLVVGGSLAFRGRPEQLAQRLHHGTINHFVLALLSSLVAVPLLLLLIQLGRENAQDTTFVIEAYGVAYKHTFLLSLAVLLGLLALAPYLGLYISDILRRRAFIAAAEAYEGEEEFEEEVVPEEPEVLPHEPGYVHPDTDDAGWEEVDVIDETESPESSMEEDFAAPQGEDWPESRDGEGEEPEAPEEGSIMAAWTAAQEEEDAEPEEFSEPPEEPEEEPPELAEEPEWLDEMPEEEPEPILPPVDAPQEDEPVPDESPLESSTMEEKPYYGYKGPSYSVVELEGIGPKYAERLAESSIRTTAALLAHDAGELAKEIDVPVKTVQGWQYMAELVAIKGIGPQYAEALVRAGVKGIPDLKKRSANRIAAQVNAYLEGIDANVLGAKITEHRVEGWKETAKDMRKVRMKRPED